MMDEQEIFQELYGCVSCHQAPVDRSENPNSRLCRRCREAAIHYPIPKISIPVVLVILVLTAFAYIRMPESLTDYRIYATAEAQIEAGMLNESPRWVIITWQLVSQITTMYPSNKGILGCPFRFRD